MRIELLDKAIFTEDELIAVERQAEKEIRDAVEFARNSPEPVLETIYDYLYA